jgi:MFS family permease/quinol monooxygenase YgiN
MPAVPGRRRDRSLERSPSRRRGGKAVSDLSSSAKAWAPLRLSVFRWLWLAVLGANIGIWMQTVGAQWLLVSRPGASTLVSLVQTAAALPVVLLAFPAGVLADSFDRRKLLISVQCFAVAVGVGLTWLTIVGAMPPALLLTFTAMFGVCAALTVPAYQSLIPELVPREELPSAAALGSISINLARAVGPAVAGLLIARVGVAAVFGLNAAAYLALGLVLVWWRRPATSAAADPERFVPALRAGSRYIRFSPVVRRILLRSALFVVPAMVIWALLPLIASRRLGLGAGGYGLLLGALGVGAVAAAFTLPRLRASLSANQMLLIGSLLYAAVTVAVVAVHSMAVVALVLLFAGAAWTVVLSNINATLQLFLPAWVRARGLAVYLMVLFGGQAFGALAWGLVAQRVGLVNTFLAAAVLMTAGAASIRFWPYRDIKSLDRAPAVFWPEPHLVFLPDPDDGPVLVNVAYTVRPARRQPFLDAMQSVRQSRLRTGATRWELYQDGSKPDHFVESFTVASWEEHLRQHSDRLTGADRAFQQEADRYSDPRPRTTHLFPARGTQPPAAPGTEGKPPSAPH